MKTAMLTLTGLIEAAAACLIGLSLLQFFAEAHFLFELLTHFKVAYGVCALLTAIAFVWVRRWFWAALMVACCLVNAVWIMPWYVNAHPRAMESSRSSIKLLLANVQSSNTQTAPLLALIKAEKPDFIVLQEVNKRWSAAMAELAGSYPFRLEIVRGDNFGIAAYATKAWADARSIPSPPLGFPTLVVDRAAGHSLRLVTTHPHTPVGQWGYDARNTQILSLVELVNESELPVLVIGDLNATLWSPVIDELEKLTGLRNIRQGIGIVPTWPTWFAPLMIPIDQGLHTPGITIRDVRAGPHIGSDHLPLLVELHLT